MSKDLLKEAIADAKAVRETAIANAKLALEEAFTPKLQSMLSTKIREDYEDELEDEEELDVDVEAEFTEDEEFDVSAEDEVEDEVPVADEEDELGGSDEEELGLGDDDDSLELEAIIRELEGEDEEEAPVEDEEEVAVEDDEVVSESEEEEEADSTDDADFDLGEVIKALQEEDEEEAEEAPATDDLEEAYKTIRFLKDKINEVNLLNAKLLFSNKLFRNGNLNEDQKMRVIETFDRANSVREVKLVYSTLAESMKSMKSSTNKKAMTEGLASKSTRSTKPSKGAIVESNNFSDRMRKLAGLI
jgi:hypothetical protein